MDRLYPPSKRDKEGKKVCATRQLPAEAIEAFVVERVQAALADPEMRPLLEAQLAPLGLVVPRGDLTTLWEALTLPNRRRLIALMVEEARVDQLRGKLSVRFRDLADLPVEEEAHADH
ncbi:MAG: hypothetical protein HY823_02710 [Acidobacteria bacterium]|nr:hypothetical protein [Acidobacteriota bacterium]